MALVPLIHRLYVSHRHPRLIHCFKAKGMTLTTRDREMRGYYIFKLGRKVKGDMHRLHRQGRRGEGEGGVREYNYRGGMGNKSETISTHARPSDRRLYLAFATSALHLYCISLACLAPYLLYFFCHTGPYSLLPFTYPPFPCSRPSYMKRLVSLYTVF